ncbi:MAG: tryptophanase [Clostridiales bacterium]|nr:tryptophanase [Clostridiales bacterium]
MSKVTFFSGEQTPLEMHKVRIVQKLNLRPVRERVSAMTEAGFNTFLLRNEDVFLDMLTDSGTNAMSDKQQAAMMVADDSYAGSATFYRLEARLREMFGMDVYFPVHQGRAAESILAQTLITRPGMVVPMNYHFTTAKAHITRVGGVVEELVRPEGLEVTSDLPFKGDMDIDALRACIEKHGAENIAFLRIEAGTNLIGGQPVSLKNFKEACGLAHEYGILTVMDASLLQDNLYFIKMREEACKDMSIREITLEIANQFDCIYFSSRKLGFARGGGMCFRDGALAETMKAQVPLFEGFLTYGGMSVREMEAMAVGLDESMAFDVISQAPQFIAYMCAELQKNGVPVVTPPGGLGCHLNAREFLPHLDDHVYPAGALAAAAFIAGGVRGMERGTLSEQREPDGTEPIAQMELLRLALPRRVFTLSQVRYAIDRVTWLYQNRHLVGGLRWIEEPEVLRFFFGRLAPIGDWPDKLAEQFEKDFGDSL